MRTPRAKVERLYEERWEWPQHRPNAPFEYKMGALVDVGEYVAVAMHFRNAYIAGSRWDPREILDEYRQCSDCESLNGHVSEHHGLETRLRMVGIRALMWSILWTILEPPTD